MGIEFTILKDFSTVSITAVELSAVDDIITTHIQSPVFRKEYDYLIRDIVNTYRVVLDNLQPLIDLHSEQAFEEQFDALFHHYSCRYLKEISVPRVNAEFTYEKYLQFRKLKEVNTGFPLLKRAFGRLHDFIDKWLDNDIWLAMTIDSLFKMFFRLLNEISELKTKDPEDAYLIYRAGLPICQPYLDMISESLKQIATRR